MEIKLFGKSLFSASKAKSDLLFYQSNNHLKESKYLPDFCLGSNTGGSFENSISDFVITSTGNGGAVAVPVSKNKGKKEVKKEEIHITPKGVYDLELLHDKTFKLNTDEKYVDGQIADFKDKLSLIKSEEYDMNRGVKEISSILVRLENRKKYEQVKDFFVEYPYTTTSKIDGVVKAHDYLKLGQVAQFLTDMPKEAVEAMKKYNEYTKKICDKQAVFYIIADKKDFQKSNSRRDPILLAQSPFGHFWQILGAWDKEMMFLEEL